MVDLVLRGGLVLTTQGPAQVDVAITAGQITEVGGSVEGAGAEVLECSGAWVGPGLVDLHAHLREPGQEWKEDIETGSEAAAAGGFTTVVAMPNTDPPTDQGHLARYMADRGREVGLIDVIPAGAVTRALRGAELAHLDDLRAAGVTIFSDDGMTVADGGLLRRAMEYLREGDSVLAQHAEDPGLSRGGHMHEGARSARLGIEGIPALAEEVVVARDLALVRLTGCRYHVQHVSSAGTVDLIRSAKEEGLPVTAEVTPHHLAFDDSAVETADPRFKMYPPLRESEDLAALRDAVSDGTIDVVATDHAPHSAHEWEVPFEEAPRGVIGLETAAAVVNTFRDLPPDTFFERLALSPGRIAGVDVGPVQIGRRADLMVFDPDRAWTVDRFHSRSAKSPFQGTVLKGAIRFTVFRGRVTFRDGKVVR